MSYQAPPSPAPSDDPPECSSPSCRLRFGPFLLDERELRLLRDGEPISIQAQPLKLLALLASRPGHVVRREEIRDHLWGDTLVDYEQGINYAVRQVRQALGDDAANPSWVETVPGRGYRFVGEVEEETAKEPISATAPQPAEAAEDAASGPAGLRLPIDIPIPSEWRFALVPVGALVVAGLLMAFLTWNNSGGEPEGGGAHPAAFLHTEGPPRIVVLPFEEIPAVGGTLGRPLAEEVSLVLTRHGRAVPDRGELAIWDLPLRDLATSKPTEEPRPAARFQVLGVETVRRLETMDEEAHRRTLRELDVDFLVTGRVVHRRSVLPSGTLPGNTVAGEGEPSSPREDPRLRVTARLIDARAGDELWAARYMAGEVVAGEGVPPNPFDADAVALTDLPRVARQVALAVVLEMTGEQVKVPPARRAAMAEAAYAHYLRGRQLSDTWLFLQRPEAEDYLLEAKAEFQQALEKDSGLSGAYLELARIGAWRPKLLALEGWPMRRLLKESLALDPLNEVAWTEAAAVAFFRDGDLEQARRLLDRALAINPGLPAAVELDAAWLTARGDLAAATARTHEAMALEPLSLLMTTQGMNLLYRQDEWTAAEEAIRWGLELERRLQAEAEQNNEQLLPPRCLGCREVTTWLALHRGDWATARTALLWQMETLGHQESERILDDSDLGDREALETHWRAWLEGQAEEGARPTCRQAFIELQLGWRNQALETLEQATRNPRDYDRLYLAVSPFFDDVRGDPRFEALVDRILEPARDGGPGVPAVTGGFEAAALDAPSLAGPRR